MIALVSDLPARPTSSLGSALPQHEANDQPAFVIFPASRTCTPLLRTSSKKFASRPGAGNPHSWAKSLRPQLLLQQLCD